MPGRLGRPAVCGLSAACQAVAGQPVPGDHEGGSDAGNDSSEASSTGSGSGGSGWCGGTPGVRVTPSAAPVSSAPPGYRSSDLLGAVEASSHAPAGSSRRPPGLRSLCRAGSPWPRRTSGRSRPCRPRTEPRATPIVALGPVRQPTSLNPSLSSVASMPDLKPASSGPAPTLPAEPPTIVSEPARGSMTTSPNASSHGRPLSMPPPISIFSQLILHRQRAELVDAAERGQERRARVSGGGRRPRRVRSGGRRIRLDAVVGVEVDVVRPGEYLADDAMRGGALLVDDLLHRTRVRVGSARCAAKPDMRRETARWRAAATS